MTSKDRSNNPTHVIHIHWKDFAIELDGIEPFTLKPNDSFMFSSWNLGEGENVVTVKGTIENIIQFWELAPEKPDDDARIPELPFRHYARKHVTAIIMSDKNLDIRTVERKTVRDFKDPEGTRGQ